MFCNQCGKEIGDAKFCPYCGAAQDATTPNQGEYQPIEPQQNYQQQGYQQPNYARSDDQPNMGFSILSFFIPVVGLVLYFVWKQEYPQKAKSCLKGLLAGVILYVVGVCCLMSSAFFIASQDPYSYNYYSSNDAIVENV